MASDQRKRVPRQRFLAGTALTGVAFGQTAAGATIYASTNRSDYQDSAWQLINAQKAENISIWDRQCCMGRRREILAGGRA
jgi:hypothetical protein